MKSHYKYSKLLHWIVLLTFFLPFFYTGCQPQSIEEKEQATLDSIEEVTHPIDSLATENSEPDTLSRTKVDSTFYEKEEKNELPSVKLAKKISFLKPLLIPATDSYSGIAVVIDSFNYIILLGVLNSFLLLLISLIIKYFDKISRKSIAILNLLALIFLSVSHPYSWDSKLLWGYWVCLIMSIILIIYDLLILRIQWLLAKKSIEGFPSP